MVVFVLCSVSQSFFYFQYYYSVLKILGGTPGWFIRYKNQTIVTIGGTPGTSSRQPGCASLVYGIITCIEGDSNSDGIIWVNDSVFEWVLLDAEVENPWDSGLKRWTDKFHFVACLGKPEIRLERDLLKTFLFCEKNCFFFKTFRQNLTSN